MKNLKIKTINLTVYLSGLLLVSSASFCYAEPLPDSGLIIRETQKLPETPKNKVKTTLEKVEPEQQSSAVSQNDLRFKVTNFKFQGNTQFTNLELNQLLGDYLNREIAFHELTNAAKIITNYYRQAGFFIALVYVPQQSIKQGEVEMTVLEGRLDDSHLTQDTIQALNGLRLYKPVLKRFLETHEAGELITKAEMDHLSLLVNDVAGLESKIVLARGNKTGSSSLNLKVKPTPLISGYLLTDNHGLYSTGYYRFNTGLSINNPTGLGDQINLGVLTTETANTVAGWADYIVPINGYGTKAKVSFSELHYQLGRAFTPLKVDGIARTVGFSLIHPVWLTRDARINATVGYEHRWLEDNIELFESYNDRELNVASFSLDGIFNDNLLISSGQTQASLKVSVGEVSFDDSTAYESDKASGLESNGGYHKFYWKINRLQKVLWGFSLYANFEGQIASKNLDSSEQMSLGGANGIRAYPVGEGSADEGWLFNGEVRYLFPRTSYVPGSLYLSAFVDTGYSRVNANPLAGDANNSRHLTGYGIGLKLLNMKGFNLYTSIAWRDTQTQPNSDPNANGPMMYFQLLKTF